MLAHPSSEFNIVGLLPPNNASGPVVLALRSVNNDGGREMGGAAVTYPLENARIRAMQRAREIIARRCFYMYMLI